jgi:hypothetical protein
MSKTEIRKEISQKKKQALKDKLASSTPVLVAKGLWTFAEGTALLVTSLFAIYQAYRNAYPVWGKYILIVSGVLVLYPAALLLSKFFRAAGSTK